MPLDFKNAQNTRYLISVQRELPNQWLIEGGYTGSHGWNLTTGGGGQAGEIEMNAIPQQYLSSSRVRDQATIDFLAALVPNPFRGLLPGTALQRRDRRALAAAAPVPAVRQRPNLRRQRHQQLSFGAVQGGEAVHEGLHAAGGVHLVAVQGTGVPAESVRHDLRRSTVGVRRAAPRHASAGSWNCRSATGGRLPPNANRFTDAFIGGWSLQAIGQLQSGQPIDLNARNVYFNGDPASLKTDYSGDTNNPVFDISGFYFHDAAVQTNGVDDPVKQRADTRIRLANNVRYFPSKTDGLRSPKLNLWDISIIKQVRLSDRVRGQFHIELLNAFNRAVYANPNTDPTNADFGKVTSQTNLPRDIQLAMKVVF